MLDTVLSSVSTTGIENRNVRVQPNSGARIKTTLFKRPKKSKLVDKSPVRTKLAPARRLSEDWDDDDNRHDVTGTWEGHIYTAPLERRVLRSSRSSIESFQSLA